MGLLVSVYNYAHTVGNHKLSELEMFCVFYQIRARIIAPICYLLLYTIVREYLHARKFVYL